MTLMEGVKLVHFFKYRSETTTEITQINKHWETILSELKPARRNGSFDANTAGTRVVRFDGNVLTVAAGNDSALAVAGGEPADLCGKDADRDLEPGSPGPVRGRPGGGSMITDTLPILDVRTGEQIQPAETCPMCGRPQPPGAREVLRAGADQRAGAEDIQVHAGRSPISTICGRRVRPENAPDRISWSSS